MIASRDEEKVGRAAREMNKIGTVVSTRCNIRKEEDVRRVFHNHIRGC